MGQDRRASFRPMVLLRGDHCRRVPGTATTRNDVCGRGILSSIDCSIPLEVSPLLDSRESGSVFFRCTGTNVPRNVPKGEEEDA